MLLSSFPPFVKSHSSASLKRLEEEEESWLGKAGKGHYKMPGLPGSVWHSRLGVPGEVPVRAHGWLAGQAPGWGYVGQATDVSFTHGCFPCSFSLPSPLSQNK